MSGEGRKPRSVVMLNGVRFAFISWEVNNNGYYQADTFSVRLPLTQPQAQSYNAAWWSTQTGIEIKIYDGFPKDADNYTAKDLTLRLWGNVDNIELDPIGKTVHITGRDYTSKLIDEKVPPPSPNLTASQAAEKFAAQYGLATNITKTTTKIGIYYNLDHIDSKLEKTPWDILTYLAHQEQFVVYCSGKTLNFIPQPSEKSAKVLTLDDSNRITTGPAPMLKFFRCLTVSRGIVVYVRSWNGKHKRGFSKVARIKRSRDPVTKKNEPLIGVEQAYSYTFPNLTEEEAQRRADSYLKSISQHEVKFEASDMPGDPSLSPFQPVKWQYGKTQFEQVYFLDSLVRSFSLDHGYIMSLKGKNHSVESVVLA